MHFEKQSMSNKRTQNFLLLSLYECQCGKLTEISLKASQYADQILTRPPSCTQVPVHSSGDDWSCHAELQELRCSVAQFFFFLEGAASQHALMYYSVHVNLKYIALPPTFTQNLCACGTCVCVCTRYDLHTSKSFLFCSFTFRIVTILVYIK
jgi:hypothetical protein